MAAYDAELNYAIRQRQRQAATMEKFISDQSKADKLAALITSQVSPSVAKPKMSKFATQTDALDSVIPENHPLKGFGPELRDRLLQVAQHPLAKQTDPGSLAAALARKMLAEPGKSGIPRFEEAAEFKRRADAAWFGIFGPDESVKKPLGPLYDEWLRRRREAEKPENIAARLRAAGMTKEAEEVLREASPVATPLGAGVQAAIGAGIGAIRTKSPIGALLGAAGGVMSEVFGRPISKAIEETEWYKSLAGPLTATRSAPSVMQAVGQGLLLGGVASIGGKSKLGKGLYAAAGATIGAGAATDTGKALLATMAPYAATGVFDEALLKTFMVPRAVAKTLAAKPTARNVVDAADAIEGATKELKNPGIISKISSRIFSDTPYKFGINPEVEEAFKYMARSLTASGREANRNRSIMSAAIQQHLAKTPAIWKAIEDARTAGMLRDLEGLHNVERMSSVVQEHLKGVQSIWDELAAKGAREIPPTAEELEKTFPRLIPKLSNAIVDTLGKLDDTALNEALRHPSLNPVVGIIHAASRQRARALTDPATAQQAVNSILNNIRKAESFNAPTIDKARSTVAKILGSDKNLAEVLSGKAPANVALAKQLESMPVEAPVKGPIVRKAESIAEAQKEAHEIIYGSEVFGKSRALDEAHELLYGKKRIATSAPAAKAIDEAATIIGAKPSAVFDEVAKRADEIESHPVVRKVLNVSSEPTELGAATAPSTANPIVSDVITRKVVGARSVKPKIKPEPAAEAKPAATEAAKVEAEKGIGEAVEANVRRLPPVGTIKKTKVGGEDVFTEIIDTALGPQEVVYKSTNRLAAVKKVQEAAANEARQVQYIKEVRIYSKLTPEEAKEEVGELLKLYDSGKIKLEELKHRIIQITDSQTLEEFDRAGNFVGKKFGSEDGLGVWLRQFDPLLSKINSMLANKTFAAIFGGSAALYTMFMDPQSGELGGKPAEAGVVESIARGISSAREISHPAMNLLRQLKEARYLVSHGIPENKFLITKDEFQVGLRGSEYGGPAVILRDINAWAKNVKDNLLYRIMSPGMQFELGTTAGKGVMNNPATFRASFQTAEYVNKMLASKVVMNILRDANIKSAKNEVREAYKHLAQNGMMKQVEYDWRSFKIKELEAEIERLTKNGKKYPPDVLDASLEAANRELAQHQAAIEGLKDFLPQYHQEWERITTELAHKHPAVRVFLAVGDNANFDKFPFLRSVVFTPEEKAAVGRFKEQLIHYRERIKAIKEETISGDYVPYVFHPDFKPDDFTKMIGDPDRSAAYLRIFRRSFNSRPLMPDIETAMLRYVSDTETRIQNIDFWKIQGWENVYEKTKYYPVIHNAFKVIREGLRPIDMTFGNKFAQRYAEFESVFRLMLSPSATLKHLIKQTADIAQRGVSETVEAYPIAGKALIQRAIEANPKISAALSGMGIKVKSEQDRLILDYFKSVAPAHGLRKFLLDTGLPLHEDIFAKAKGLWGRIQEFSGAGINFAEMWDRGLTVALGNQIAAKTGMTVEQAMYGTYDMLLKNNFLSRELNPSWLHNPKIKAMAMFQGTPFKIMERRLVNAIRTGRVIRDLGREIYDMTKKDIASGSMTNTRLLLRDLRNLRADIKAGEQAFKNNIFLSALNQEVDFFGTPIINTFVKDIAIVAAATYIGAESGMSLYHHFFHVPFLKPGTTHPTLSLNPGLQAIFNGLDAYNKREEGDDEFLTTKIFQKWLGSGWYAALPDPVKKLHRISINDIPEIYRGSKYKYLFAIPAKEK